METNVITVIEPRRRWITLDLRDIWKHRELLFFLVWRDVKVRYKQTAMGVLWAILQPILTTLIFTILFSRFAEPETAGVPYPLFALSGLLIWFFVNAAINRAAWSLVSNRNMVTKVYFPRLLIVFAAALAGLVDLLLSLVILIGLLIYYATGFTWQIALAPFFILLTLILATACGTFFAALNVRYRDVRFLLPFLLQIWMFVSPVFYPSSLVTERWRPFFELNPLTGLIDGFRSSILGKPFNWYSIIMATAFTLILGMISLIVFKRMEDDFADLI